MQWKYFEKKTIMQSTNEQRNPANPLYKVFEEKYNNDENIIELKIIVPTQVSTEVLHAAFETLNLLIYYI